MRVFSFTNYPTPIYPFIFQFKELFFMKKFLLLATLMYIGMYTAHAQAESDIVITEIMYNPPGSDSLEFIELYNKSEFGINLTGWKFTNGITASLSGIFISPGSYIILAKNKDIFEATFGMPATEWQDGGLSNSGEALVLRNAQDMIMDTLRYNDKAPWPTGPIDPDGKGASIALCDPESDNNDPVNWEIGDTPTGIYIDGDLIYAHPNNTCSGLDLIPPIPEHAHAISQNEIVVEFNEPVNQTAELSANYTGIGTLVADRDPAAREVTLTLDTPLSDGVLTTFCVENVQDFPGNQMTDLNTECFEVIWHSTGEIRDIVITEIMYNAPGNDSLDFIELYNRSGIDRNLWGCFFDAGIDFEFPEYILGAGEYVILAEDSANFELTYGITPFKWSGNLDNNSEKIIFNFVDGDTIDLVDYNDNMGWDTLADGLGYSLVLCDYMSDNTDSLNWTIATTTTGIFIEDSIEVIMGTDTLQQAIQIEMFANPGEYDNGCPVAVQSVEELTGVSIYPNPNNGVFLIENQENTQLEYQIFDLYGREIQRGNLNNYQEEIQLKNAPSGVYLLHLKDEFSSKSVAKKIVKS